jgi:hypothetical protein
MGKNDKRIKKTIHILFLFSLYSCTGIQEGKELNEKERAYIQEIGLLDSNETILMFYSSMDFKSSGNFITDRRVASYWIYENKDIRQWVYYNEIKDLDVRYGGGFTTTQIKVIRKDGSWFNVNIDHEHKEREKLFLELLQKNINNQ